MSSENEENLFHKHLDRCAQCREQPFNLCPKGALFLQHEGGKASEALAKSGSELFGFGKR